MAARDLAPKLLCLVDAAHISQALATAPSSVRPLPRPQLRGTFTAMLPASLRSFGPPAASVVRSRPEGDARRLWVVVVGHGNPHLPKIRSI